jgi:uncharacterized protein (DUF1684 family)
MMETLSRFEALADYRRLVGEMYAYTRAGSPAEQRWVEFCRERDSLFAAHPQSALSPQQKARFSNLSYFPYNPQLRFVLPVEAVSDAQEIVIELPDEGATRMRPFGRVHFEVDRQAASLTLFWILGYGGGIFLPFRDLTNSHETYGGGRYLLDTIKNAYLGREASGLVLDFNFAYNPSCAYNPRWVCPLAPVENRLSVPIRAGELAFADYPTEMEEYPGPKT